MRGPELPAEQAAGAEDAAEYMQECHAFEGEDRSGEPAVFVRASAPGSRDVYHRDEHCAAVTGGGRRPEEGSWMLRGIAEETGYRPCGRCGSPA